MKSESFHKNKPKMKTVMSWLVTICRGRRVDAELTLKSIHDIHTPNFLSLFFFVTPLRSPQSDGNRQGKSNHWQTNDTLVASFGEQGDDKEWNLGGSVYFSQRRCSRRRREGWKLKRAEEYFDDEKNMLGVEITTSPELRLLSNKKMNFL